MQSVAIIKKSPYFRYALHKKKGRAIKKPDNDNCYMNQELLQKIACVGRCASLSLKQTDYYAIPGVGEN